MTNSVVSKFKVALNGSEVINCKLKIAGSLSVFEVAERILWFKENS